MSTIYPGNYVCTLSGWAGQGVEAIPGGEFYRILGYVKVTSSDTGSTNPVSYTHLTLPTKSIV